MQTKHNTLPQIRPTQYKKNESPYMILPAFELCSTLHLPLPSLFRGESYLQIEYTKHKPTKLIKCNNEKLKSAEVCDHTYEYKEKQIELIRFIKICSKLEQIVPGR